MKYRKVYFFLVFIVIPFITKCHNEHILASSIPKCGSHLLYKCLYLITGRLNSACIPEDMYKLNREKTFAAFHGLPNKRAIEVLKSFNAKVILIIRDPRDQIVSGANYFSKYFNEFKKMTVDQKIRELTHNSCFWTGRFMRDMPHNGSINVLYRKMLEWREYPFVYIVKFEDLVGEKGGGSRVASVTEVINIANHINCTITVSRAEVIADMIFGTIAEPAKPESLILNYSFKAGKIGQWQNVFSDQQKKLFKTVVGQLLVDLHYEQDFDW